MITKDNTTMVMELFFKHPDEKFHLRYLERLTGLSLPGVRKIVNKLRKEGLLESKKENVVLNYYATRNEKFNMLKKCYNIYSLQSSGLLDFLRKRYEEPEAIVLFGSYGKGEDISGSDVDIAVITTKRISVDILIFEKRLERKITIHEISLKKAEKEFLNTLVNGIVLYGYLKVL
ncbi:MAG: nucleotidyltransferase domain-containing protein [Candidatus Aenigmatarchaeota archaeon]